MPLGAVGVRGDEREAADQLDRLARDVLERHVVRRLVIGIQVEHAALELVHHVAAGRFEDHVLVEPVWQAARALQQAVEARLLLARRQFAEQQQIGDLLVAEGAAFVVGVHDVLHADAAVIQLAGDRNAHAVLDVVALHAADVAHADDDAGAVGIAQAALDAWVVQTRFGDAVLRSDIGTERVDVVIERVVAFGQGRSPLSKNI